MRGHDGVMVVGAASWNRMIYVDSLPQGQSATIFSAQTKIGAGSTGVGKSMVLAALDCAPSFHCALGRDAMAHKIISACEERGIDMIVDYHDAPTPQHLNIMDRNGGRYSIFLSNGAPDPEIDAQRLEAKLKASSTIFLSLSCSTKKALPLLADCSAEVLLDLHDYDGENPWYDDFIPHADVVQLSDVALPAYYPVVERLLAGRARQVVVTKGGNGAEIFTPSAHANIPVHPVTMIDSNGAGDAFSVGLWLAQRHGLGLEQAGRFAAATAAFAIEDESLFPTSVSIGDIQKRCALGPS